MTRLKWDFPLWTLKFAALNYTILKAWNLIQFKSRVLMSWRPWFNSSIWDSVMRGNKHLHKGAMVSGFATSTVEVWLVWGNLWTNWKENAGCSVGWLWGGAQAASALTLVSKNQLCVHSPLFCVTTSVHTGAWLDSQWWTVAVYPERLPGSEPTVQCGNRSRPRVDRNLLAVSDSTQAMGWGAGGPGSW